MAFDFRLLRVTFDDEGTERVFENVAITVKGARTGSWVQNSAEIVITNIDTDTRNFLATKYKPENQLRVGLIGRGFVFVDIGRESYGFFRLFEGNVVLISITPPPDISLVITVVSNYFAKSTLASKNFGLRQKLSQIAQSVADDMELQLDFNVEDDFIIPRLTYSGPVAGQLKIFNEWPFIDSFVDNGKLVIKNNGQPISENIVLINVDTEMIGIPTFNDIGINVKFLIKPGVRVGSQIRIQSRLNPAANGDYVVVNLGFDVANREVQFYYNVFATRIPS